MLKFLIRSQQNVHGDIRHLEKTVNVNWGNSCVHGDIRHLENWTKPAKHRKPVHGDIRHLEIEAI